MTYSQFTADLLSQGFQRVERDDRLLDLFPTQTREKGVELWAKDEPTQTTILRLRLPYIFSQIKTFLIPRSQLDQALSNSQTLDLEKYHT